MAGPANAGRPGFGPGGQELPSAARERLSDMAAHRSWGSSLAVNEFAAISRVGFRPVGQVLGAAVYNIGDAGDEDCPYGMTVYRGEGTPVYRGPGGLGGGPPRPGGATGPGGTGLRFGGGIRPAPAGAAAIGAARPLVSALYSARRAAISRMTAECTALGGHGVIGVTLTIGPFGGDEDVLEFRAFGTAIQAPGVTSRAQPFASDLSGQDFTKLVAHGFVPVGLALGVAVGYRHDDWLTRGQTRWSAGNVEVDGYTYLVRQMRTDARNELELDLGRMGAEGVVVREMQTRITERRCPIVPLGRDHVVEATIVGTAIAQFARYAPPAIYGIHKLNGRRPEPPREQQVAVSLGGEQGAEDQDQAAAPAVPPQPAAPGTDPIG
ncbi:MAG TPA: heavy metal-binding domain-containing protein [Streptosporangiaceae bacterium]|jgi:uncharacterized protein YbjQ (UPF0145 family)